MLTVIYFIVMVHESTQHIVSVESDETKINPIQLNRLGIHNTLLCNNRIFLNLFLFNKSYAFKHASGLFKILYLVIQCTKINIKTT